MKVGGLPALLFLPHSALTKINFTERNTGGTTLAQHSPVEVGVVVVVVEVEEVGVVMMEVEEVEVGVVMVEVEEVEEEVVMVEVEMKY